MLLQLYREGFETAAGVHSRLYRERTRIYNSGEARTGGEEKGWTQGLRTQVRHRQ